MAFTTYSFEEVSVVISHPALGQFVASGQGLKSISVSRPNDMRQDDLAGDGHVMVSKMPSPNGGIVMTCQQTSPFQDFMTKLTNYLKTAPASEFAKGTIVISPVNQNIRHYGRGVTPQKMADKNYEAAGGTVPWNLMCAELTDEVV